MTDEDALRAEFRRGFELGEANQRLRCGDCYAHAEARVRTQVAAKALAAARDELAKVAERLEAKGREPGGKLHLGTAAGVRLACFRLTEMSDEFARRHAGPSGTVGNPEERA